MRQVIWKKKSCASVSSGAPNGICKISQTGGKQPITAELEPAVSEQLSITHKLRPNGQTRQRWSNMNQYSVTVMPISRLKCFQKHLVVYCLAVKYESLNERRAMRRCRSLVFSQNTWITICWKVIMEFLPYEAKNLLPTEALIICSNLILGYVQQQTSY